ncbi:MAG TPA: hypothetical protein VF600_04725 [Abditibacteriaceae bacterium]|jgi:hypothetical protein
MIQNALTVILPIKRGEVEALRDTLTLIGDDIEDNPYLSWQSSPSTHFARFVILDPASLGGSEGKGVPSLKNHPVRLLFTSNHDGSFENYMQELVTRFGADMEPIWSKCEGYPVGASTDVPQFTKFISDHSHLKRNAAPEAFYIACRGITVQEMCQSIALREAFTNLLSLPETHDLLRHPSSLVPRSAMVPAPSTASSGFVGLVSGLLSGLLGPLASGLAEWVVGIRNGLNPNLPVYSPETQLAIEDRVTQNQMTVIVPIRRDFKARLLLPIILGAVNKLGAKSTGSLSGLTTIHFARWAIIDEGKNLFFESNFDGSWENYIDDFVDRASLGMNVIWGNCTGFPRGGCKDIEWFKKYIRDNQIPAQVFYSAYRNSSIKNNLNDLQVARTLQRLLSAAEIEQLLNGSYRLTDSALKQLMSEPATALFMSGSYNRGVARVLATPLQAAQDSSKGTPTQNGLSQGAPPAAMPGSTKKSMLSLGLVAALGLLSLWLVRRRKG